MVCLLMHAFLPSSPIHLFSNPMPPTMIYERYCIVRLHARGTMAVLGGSEIGDDSDDRMSGCDCHACAVPDGIYSQSS